MNSQVKKERIQGWFKSFALKIFDLKVFEKFLKIYYGLKDKKIFENRFENSGLSDTLEKFRQYCESAVGASLWDKKLFIEKNGYYKFFSDLYEIEFHSTSDKNNISRAGHIQDLILILLSMGILSEELEGAKDTYSAREFETVTEVLSTINPISAEKTEKSEEITTKSIKEILKLKEEIDDLKKSIGELEQKNEGLSQENQIFQEQIGQQQTLKNLELRVLDLEEEKVFLIENIEKQKKQLMEWGDFAEINNAAMANIKTLLDQKISEKIEFEQKLIDLQQQIVKFQTDLEIARKENQALKIPLKLVWLELADSFSLKIREIPGQDTRLCICHNFAGKDIKTTVGSTP